MAERGVALITEDRLAAIMDRGGEGVSDSETLRIARALIVARADGPPRTPCSLNDSVLRGALDSCGAGVSVPDKAKMAGELLSRGSRGRLSQLLHERKVYPLKTDGDGW